MNWIQTHSQIDEIQVIPPEEIKISINVYYFRLALNTTKNMIL